MMRETTPDGRTVVTETVKVTRKTYTQDWKAYNYAQTHEKSELQALLFELCKNLPEPVERRGKGRPPLCMSDIVFSSVTKVYSTISGRRFATDLREAKARGYLAHLPHYNSVFKYLEGDALTPYLNELITLSAAPLKSIESDFAVDQHRTVYALAGREIWHERRPSPVAQTSLNGGRQNQHCHER